MKHKGPGRLNTGVENTRGTTKQTNLENPVNLNVNIKHQNKLRLKTLGPKIQDCDTPDLYLKTTHTKINCVEQLVRMLTGFKAHLPHLRFYLWIGWP